MAEVKEDKKSKEAPKQEQPKQSKVSYESFKLKKSYNGNPAGSTIKGGPKLKQFLTRNNII